MEPIRQGATGAAIEDIHSRLTSLGYQIAPSEIEALEFGSTTAQAVARFRVEHDLMLGSDVDDACWSVLVDETYTLGERTLYLRLPNFHGADVRTLQTRLNILGFSCGQVDGYFGAHTEAAVKQFQENVGLLADGMAFLDTYDAINRLRHVWDGSSAQGPHPTGGMGFARAAHVLETTSIAINGEDPISRNIAGRIYNLASATTEKSRLFLCDDAQCPTGITSLVIGTQGVEIDSNIANVIVEDHETLPARIRTAWASSQEEAPLIRLELPCTSESQFTTSDAQTFAVMLLDALCTAFDEI